MRPEPGHWVPALFTPGCLWSPGHPSRKACHTPLPPPPHPACPGARGVAAVAAGPAELDSLPHRCGPVGAWLGCLLWGLQGCKGVCVADRLLGIAGHPPCCNARWRTVARRPRAGALPAGHPGDCGSHGGCAVPGDGTLVLASTCICGGLEGLRFQSCMLQGKGGEWLQEIYYNSKLTRSIPAPARSRCKRRRRARWAACCRAC